MCVAVVREVQDERDRKAKSENDIVMMDGWMVRGKEDGKGIEPTFESPRMPVSVLAQYRNLCTEALPARTQA